ncbi:MAG: hypothetical protein ACI85Q_001147 [Salibacteraceae bacterium]|jgi:uncharacterized protein (DUF58 family)
MADLISKQNIREFSKLEWFARQVVEGFITGLHKSPFHGFSVEFAEHRQYNPGDSIRHIDWKLFGRTDKYYVKRYEEETNLRCQIVIDHSSSMFFPVGEDENKMSFSVHAAAALTHLFKSQRDAVGLSLFSDKVDVHLPPKLSVSHTNRMYAHLEHLLQSVPTGTLTNVASAFHEISDRVHQRSLVLVFSDMLDGVGTEMKPLFSALQHLKYNKHEVVVFHVTDRSKEIEFNYENRPYTFVDLESGDEVKLNPSQIKDHFKESALAHEKEVKLKCSQYGIDFVKADISDGYDQILRVYLDKRKRMK